MESFVMKEILYVRKGGRGLNKNVKIYLLV